MLSELSEDHPLQDDPTKWWPYAVVIGYRKTARRIIARRTVYVRSNGHAQAELAAIRHARGSGPVVKDELGSILKASRAVSVRPLDKCDCIGGTA